MPSRTDRHLGGIYSELPPKPSSSGAGRDRPGVEKVFLQLVSTDEQGRKQVDHSGLIAPPIEPVKELDDRVRTLEARCGQAGERTGQEGQPEADRTIHRRTPE